MRGLRIRIFSAALLVLPVVSHATFIEATIGTAVVNDATASFYNPAALTLLKNSQIIGLGSYARFNTQFSGQTRQVGTGFTQSGVARSTTNYSLPAIYAGFPTTQNVTFGFAVVYNAFNREVDDNSILRYVQGGNSTEGIDLVPAVGFKVNEYLALGANLNMSYARFDLQPVSGFPTINVPDSESRNDSSGAGIGADAGLLFKPRTGTLIGFNYRGTVRYKLSGTSTLYANPLAVSTNYQSTIWTPARYVISASQFLSPKVVLIGTLQRIQWSIFDTVHVSGAITQAGTSRVLVNSYIPYYMHDSMIYTVAGNYFYSQALALRTAVTYIESPGNTHYQLVNGDSLVVGASAGYRLSSTFTLDGSYAHVFLRGAAINITQGRNWVNGVNRAERDGVSLKLTVNV